MLPTNTRLKRFDTLSAPVPGRYRLPRIIGELTTSETRLYISSLQPVAKTVERAIRKHWAIENSLHWVLDMAFREDECRKRKDNLALKLRNPKTHYP
ncbi:MAG TPA: ISAs1 family transposase [Spirochaetales bacterium]|nr:ISAs1 family transposase [Spirochaetales bacterium]